MQTKEVIEKIQEIANQNQARPDVVKVKQVPDLKVGECYRQGDLYVFKVADDHPVGKKLDRRQLADGQSIGQRHVLLGEFQIYEGKKAPCKTGDLYIKAGAVGYA